MRGLSTPDGLERVPRRTVIDHWLALEADKRDDNLDADRIDELSTREAHEALLARKPGAAAIFHADPAPRWYRLQLREAELRRLRYIDGPADSLWGGLADDRRVLDGARRIQQEPPATLAAETGVDVEHILADRERVAAGESVPAPVLLTRRGRAQTRILDGNHRVTAVLLHLLETGEYDPMTAYLGSQPNPIVRPLRERLAGLVRSVVEDRRF
ncbi:hypothetical protein [Haloarchaeobius salinus]|uniref:hypothetical protein n=1 Tax=Haloarchaeobius salinus TaxID=1198298 RepID=UPI00210BBEE6|nr:hypothetical protein [Haloarchaeobius salinus]